MPRTVGLPVLSKKCFRQAAVYGNQVSCGAAGSRAGEIEYRLSTIFGIDWLMRESPLRIKLRQRATQFFVCGLFAEGNFVLGEGSDDAIPRKHRGAFHDGGRADAVYPDAGRHADSKLADQVTDGSLAYVVGLASALGHNGVCRTREHDADVESLIAKELCRLIGQQVVRGHIYVERESPLCIRDNSIGRCGENSSGIDEYVETAKLAHRLL